MGIDEGGHREFGRGHQIGLARAGAAFVAIVQSGFVAMVAVGNHQLFLRHRFLNAAPIKSGISDGPEVVRDAVFVAQFERRALGAVRLLRARESILGGRDRRTAGKAGRSARVFGGAARCGRLSERGKRAFVTE